MEGASLPLLAAAQVVAAIGGSADSPAVSGAGRDGFAAILGATELTQLTAEQQAALGSLLADPASTLEATADPDGRALPTAAIMHGLLEALGVDSAATLRNDGTAEQAGADSLKAVPADQAQGGEDPAALLALLFPPAAATSAPQATPPRGPGAAPVRAAWSLLGSAPDETGAGLPTEQQGSKAPGTSLPAVNPIAAAVDRASAALAAQGSVAGAAAGTGTASTVLGEPAAFLAALQSSAGEVGAETGSASGLARGLAGALDVTPASGEPVAPAGAAGLAPPRGHRPVAESVAVPVGERGWDRAFGERVVWLVGQQIHAAEVKLNPPHLGPVEVRLSLTGQDASVSFTVTHAATRDAIEQAIPRLRELFAEQQLQIVNVDVGQRDAASQAPQGDRWGRAGGASAGAPETAGAPGARPPVVVHRSGAPGLVDEYV